VGDSVGSNTVPMTDSDNITTAAVNTTAVGAETASGSVDVNNDNSQYSDLS